MKTVFVSILLAAALGGGTFLWLGKSSNSQGPSFRTAVVERDDLLVTIAATGTVEPEEVVDVGAQVAGRIVEFGKDPQTGKLIDYNSVVEAGTVLARIDDALYKEEVNAAAAQLARAKSLTAQAKTTLAERQAGVVRAEADLKQYEARFVQAERDLGRAQKLLANNALSQQEYDLLQAAYDTTQATVGVGKAAILQAQSATETAEAAIEAADAEVAAAQASLNRAERNFDYTTIRSPINGIIVARRVNIGQTVIASLNAPSLFLIAKDLRRIQVWASVNEADIGRIRQGQAVRFNVDAFPGETFSGKVSQIRLDATMTQNVVTYTVIVDADNADGKLRPYLTANLQFEAAQRSNVLLVPNAALRYKPRAEVIEPNSAPSGEVASGAGGKKKPATDRGTLWVESGTFVRPISVRIGAADGMRTEIESNDLKEGDRVVVGEQINTGGPAESNPLAPKVYGGNRNSGN
jgi:HlyD family secretion protein